MVGALPPEASLLKLRERCASFYHDAILSPLSTFRELSKSTWSKHTVAALALYECTVSLRSMPRKQEEECLSPSLPFLSSSLVFQSEPWFLETS